MINIHSSQIGRGLTFKKCIDIASNALFTCENNSITGLPDNND